eukprot:g7691.t1
MPANHLVPDYVRPRWLTGSVQGQLVNAIKARMGGGRVTLTPCYYSQTWGSAKTWQAQCGALGPTLTVMRVAPVWSSVPLADAQPPKAAAKQRAAARGRVIGAFADRSFDCTQSHPLAPGGAGPKSCWMSSQDSFLFRVKGKRAQRVELAPPRYPLTGYNLFGSSQYGPCFGFDLHVGTGAFGGRVLLADDQRRAPCGGASAHHARARVTMRCAHFGRGVPGYSSTWLAGSTNFLTDTFITYRVDVEQQ